MRAIARGLREPAGVAFRDGALYVSAVEPHPALRRHRAAARQSRRRRSSSATASRATAITAGSSSRSAPTASSTCRSARRATSASPTRALREHHADESRRQRARGLRARRAQHRRLRLASAHARAVVHRQRPRHAGRRRPARRAQPRAARRASISATRTATAARSPIPSSAREHACSEFVAPAQKLGPHVAALGMRFYTGTQFPAEYRNQVFIAEHGSWNRSQQDRLPRDARARSTSRRRRSSYEPFAEGLAAGREAWGRPADVLVAPDGSLLVSRRPAGAIYRISYAAASAAR